jgi:hypothetical protein
MRTMEKVRFGLIGTGTWGNVHAETYSTYYRCSLAAVCDVDAARARSAADRWGACQGDPGHHAVGLEPGARKGGLLTYASEPAVAV